MERREWLMRGLGREIELGDEGVILSVGRWIYCVMGSWLCVWGGGWYRT